MFLSKQDLEGLCTALCIQQLPLKREGKALAIKGCWTTDKASHVPLESCCLSCMLMRWELGFGSGLVESYCLYLFISSHQGVCTRNPFHSVHEAQCFVSVTEICVQFPMLLQVKILFIASLGEKKTTFVAIGSHSQECCTCLRWSLLLCLLSLEKWGAFRTLYI